MTFPDFAIVVGYMLLLATIGLFVKNYSSNISDYFRAGCQGTWWLVGISVFMQGFSALAFTGISGQAFLGGWSVMTIFWSNAIIYFIHAAFFAPWLRQTRAVTPGDAVRDRFGAYTEQIFVYYSTIGGLIWGGVILLALATFTSVVFHIPLMWVILAVGVVIMFYSVIGGSWSVFTADSLQALVLFPVTLAVSGLALYHIGGLDGLFQAVHDKGLTADFAFIKPAGHVYAGDFHKPADLFTWPWTIAMFFNGVLAAFNMTGCYRYLAVKTGREAQKAALLAGILMVLGSFMWIIPPVVGRLLYEGDIQSISGIGNPVDAAYAVTAMKVLPAGLLGLILIAMFAASMSTMDSALTGTAALIVKNIYPPLRRIFRWRERSDGELLRLSRRVNFCLGACVIGLAVWINSLGGKSGLFNIMLQILVLVAAPLSLPFACALFIRRVPKWAAVFSMGTGLAASVAMTVATKVYGVEILWSRKIFIMALATIPPFFLTHFFWRSSPPAFYEKVDAFFRNIHTPIDYGKEVGKTTDYRQLGLVGKLGLVLSCMVALLMFAAKGPADYAAVGGIAAFIASISITLILLGRRRAG